MQEDLNIIEQTLDDIKSRLNTNEMKYVIDTLKTIAHNTKNAMELHDIMNKEE